MAIFFWFKMDTKSVNFTLDQWIIHSCLIGLAIGNSRGDLGVVFDCFLSLFQLLELMSLSLVKLEK